MTAVPHQLVKAVVGLSRSFWLRCAGKMSRFSSVLTTSSSIRVKPQQDGTITLDLFTDFINQLSSVFQLPWPWVRQQGHLRFRRWHGAPLPYWRMLAWSDR